MNPGYFRQRGRSWRIWFAIALCATSAAAAGADDLSAYLGTYRFADGSCVTGGRFDESGSERLLYMDVTGNRRGGLFDAGVDGGDFVSVMDRTRLAFADDGARMRWIDGDRVLQGERVHLPRVRAVRIASGKVALAGNLYLPAGTDGRRTPAIVLAHGSGPQDRFAGPWVGFFVDMGFAVLAYDKRGVGKSGGDFNAATFDDLAADLSAAVSWLVRQPGIDPERVGIHGSSQAGWYAPRVARDNRHVAFLLLRAGPSLGISRTTRHEREQEWLAAGASATQANAAGAFWEELVTSADRGASLRQAQQQLDTARSEPWFAATFKDWYRIKPKWWRVQQVDAGYHPSADLAAQPVPTLWFLAERDQNVPYAASRDALDALGPTGPTLVKIARADHGFLIRDDQGIRYTDQYWPIMASWLWEKKLAGKATPAQACR